nr:S8 family peptidase [Brevundimonas naejangsanensis]
MAAEEYSRRDLDHLRIEPFRETGAYVYPSTPQTRTALRADYPAHGQALLASLDAALPVLPAAGTDDPRLALQGLKPGSLITIQTLAPTSAKQGPGKVPVAFEAPGQDLVVLRTERAGDRSETAVVFVPDDARSGLKARLEAYADSRPSNRERPHLDQFEKIESFVAASAADLFAQDINRDDPAEAWWEVWVREGSADGLAAALRAARLDVHADRLKFPDTQVLFVHGVAARLNALLTRIPGAATEVRRAVGTIEPFLELGPRRVSQHDFVADLGDRLVGANLDAPSICILDTGVAGGHPLVAPGLSHAIAVDQRWGTDDHAPHGGHGTGLASLALYGDLEFVMNGQGEVELTHWIESVKLLPPPGFPANAVHSYGSITQSAVSLIEAERANTIRTFCLACSTDRNPPTRPSTWSGAVDQIAAGSMTGERIRGQAASTTPKRLLLVAGGNVGGGLRQDVDAGGRIEDPAQAWNALTIGGFTTKTSFGQNAVPFNAVAAANTVSPFSTDTVGLPTDLLPLKPEVLFEAGNMAEDAAGHCDWHAALSLLSAGNDVEREPLAPFWATSAAVGVASHFVGRLKAALPGLWPETYRALVVHSAQWPEPIRKRFIGRGVSWLSKLRKADVQALLRRVGFGVPDIDRAVRSARNDFTLIAQAEIQPYAAGTGNNAVFNEVHFYDLPWPRALLEGLGEASVTMRVVLSYFIEPNLSGRAATRPDTYRSYGLRFEMKKRAETDDEFRGRLSRLEGDDQSPAGAEDEGESENSGGNTSRWLIGPKAIQAGSLHCDIWRGKASELACHDMVAVHPVGGWWKSHVGQGRRTDKGRYALVLSVSAEGLDVDLHSEVNALVIEQEARVLAGAAQVTIG